jgi:hypothetical protein
VCFEDLSGKKSGSIKTWRQLLMMSGVPLETCWAFNKLWNNKFCYKAASCSYLYRVIYDARIDEYQTTGTSHDLLLRYISLKFATLHCNFAFASLQTVSIHCAALLLFLVGVVDGWYLSYCPVLQVYSRGKANWIGYILRTHCLLQHVVEGKIEGVERKRREI